MAKSVVAHIDPETRPLAWRIAASHLKREPRSDREAFGTPARVTSDD